VIPSAPTKGGITNGNNINAVSAFLHGKTSLFITIAKGSAMIVVKTVVHTPMIKLFIIAFV
jgi:hypothetical protein